jgi:hypothetical protein
MARTLDTLELFDEFKVQFTEAQAHTLSKAIKQVEQARLDELATNELATKGDLLLLRADIDKRFSEADAKIERLELRLTVKMGALITLAVGVVATLLKLK